MGVIFMALEELLAAEFAKITNDNEKTSEESTVYGTITKTEDKYYVILDGSDGVLTPISGSTFNYAEGDRVSCTIKNHSLTVTGNVTQPGLTKADDIEDGTIEPVKLVDGSLKVGVNVEMGSDVVLSWENLPSDVASDNDIPYVPSNIVTYTYIDKENVISQNLKATNLTIGGSGSSIDIKTSDLKDDKISLNYVDGSHKYQSLIKAGGITLQYLLNGEPRVWGGLSFNEVSFGDANGNSVEIKPGYIYINDMQVATKSDIPYIPKNIVTSGSSPSFTKVYVTDPGTISDERPILRWYKENGQICKTSSSRRLKKDIENVKDVSLDPNKLYNLPVRQFNYKPGTLIEGEKYTLQIGFIAEEVDEIYPSACCYDGDGNPSDWGDRHLIPPMLKLIQDQKKKIDELEERLSKLEAIVTVQNGD